MSFLRVVRAGVFAAPALFAAFLLTVASPAAAATNNPVAFDPAIQETASAQPDAVTIAFTDLVRPKAYIVVEGPDGKNVALGNPRLESTNLSVQLKTGLAHGTYTVKYRIEGKSGPEGGSYQFRIGSGTFSQKPLETWGGYTAIPKALKLPGDKEDQAKARAHASPSTTAPSDSPTTPGATGSLATDSKDTDGKDVKGASAGTGDDGSSWLPWGIGAIVVVAAALAFVARRRWTGASR